MQKKSFLFKLQDYKMYLLPHIFPLAGTELLLLQAGILIIEIHFFKPTANLYRFYSEMSIIVNTILIPKSDL